MTQPSPLGTPMPWNLVASAYINDAMPLFEHFARDALRLAAAPAGSRVVDVACGPGTLSVIAARDGFVVDALDFSPAMIEQLDARTKAAGMTVTAALGDGQALPYADAIFAAGFSMFGLMFFPDRKKGFAELRRVLAPGARAVVSSWTRIENDPVMAAMFNALRSTLKLLMGDRAPQPGAQEMPLSTEDLCRAEMSTAFADVEIHRVTHVQEYESVAAAWAAFERGMAPIVLLRKMVGEERWPAVADAAKSAMESVAGKGPGKAPTTALLSVGVAR